MSLEAPTPFNYRDYLDISAGHLKHVLLRDAWNPLRWRGDSNDRIHGGARRTFLPDPNSRVDGVLFGGNEEFRSVMELCLTAANQVMQQVIPGGQWAGNRVVMNRMPPNRNLSEHGDPLHFEDGVVVVGAGRAKLFYVLGGAEYSLDEGLESLTYIPAGMPHRVENGKLERVSVVVAYDTQQAAGRSAVGQYVGNLAGQLTSGLGAR